MKIEFLPPYSPDMNPIELCFSGMKSWVKRNADIINEAWGDVENPEHALWVLYDMAFWPTERMAFGWFNRAGVV
jgi:transposase